MASKIKFPMVLDISSWKGYINWKAVNPFPDLVICQASEGENEQDDLFEKYWNDLKDFRIKRGAYHVFSPKADCRYQIHNFLEVIEQAGGFDEKCILPILDVSHFSCNPRKVPLERKIIKCLDELSKNGFPNAIIHTNRRYWSFLRDRDGNYPIWASNYHLWLSWTPSDPHIYKRPPINSMPIGWEKWAIWKYEEAGIISGINGYVSLSTLSDDFSAQIGIMSIDSEMFNSGAKKINIEAIVIAAEGAIIRRQLFNNSKILAYLKKGSKLVGETIEFTDKHEVWLKVTYPVVGWCPIIRSGRVHLSLDHD